MEEGEVEHAADSEDVEEEQEAADAAGLAETEASMKALRIPLSVSTCACLFLVLNGC